MKFLNSISVLSEFDETFREKIPTEHQNKFHEPKNKKAFFNCINDMSYNFKDLILETWKLIQPKEENDELLKEENDELLKEENDELLKEENDELLKEENDELLKEENDDELPILDENYKY